MTAFLSDLATRGQVAASTQNQALAALLFLYREVLGRDDVIAAQEPAHRGRYGATPDDVVFERAQEDGRAVVTDNIRNYELARSAWEARGISHHGVVYALDALLDGASMLPRPLNRAHYLRPTP